MDLEATYLMWLDCRNLSLPDKELNALLIEKGRIALEPGTKYGPGGEGFVRMNIACPRETLEEGLKRLKLAFS
ncbi:cystathionine beta-lyase [Mycobacteroides abscessus subsp. abscessus]|nr:cystathionine beta-lyase [Mycobacteroides abscessus subsp. abscessus]